MEEEEEMRRRRRRRRMMNYRRKHWQTGHDSLRLLLDATSCDLDHTVIEKVRRRRRKEEEGGGGGGGEEYLGDENAKTNVGLTN